MNQLLKWPETDLNKNCKSKKKQTKKVWMSISNTWMNNINSANLKR